MTLASKAKPFLRWAGGKSWLTARIAEITESKHFGNYHEPFLGGGAVFFALHSGRKAYLSDSNDSLVNAYIAVRDNAEELIELIAEYSNDESFYYFLRNKEAKSSVELAAQFVFLNHTSYNGLYRVNRQGKYNVPYGRRTRISLNRDLILGASRALKNAVISQCDFGDSLSRISRGDLVYLDPPYTVTHNSNGFIKYNQKLFSMEDQKRLCDYISEIRRKNAYYILSNAAHPTIEELFGGIDKVIHLNRANLIGGANAQRGHVEELVITNL